MSFQISLEEGTFLVKFARKSIENALKTGKALVVPPDIPQKLMHKTGVFVTLNSVASGARELRGCIGCPGPDYPLVEATINSAINSALNDPRFPPVTTKEIDNIVVEISILTPPQLIEVKNPMEYSKEIKIGQDGLIVEKGWCKGLLLPQVPVECDWNEEEFLSNCCMKAGLPPDAWLLRGTNIYKFQAIIFEEETPKGKIKRKELEELSH